MKVLIRTSLLVCAVLLGTALRGMAVNGKIVCEGSTTVLPIAQATAEAYMDRNKDVDISVRGGGSGVGAASLIEGRCDIADCSRAFKDAELKKAAGRGKDPKAHVVAMDGIAVIVHPSNTFNELTKQQVKDIYTGKISNWSELGGPDSKIVVVSRDSASGTFEAFGELALKGAKVRADALMQAANQGVAGIVSKTPGAIGYAGLGYITPSVKPVKINGVAASRETVLSGKYPYARPLFMYTNGRPQGQVKAFIDFILSAEGQQIVEEQGFVGLK